MANQEEINRLIDNLSKRLGKEPQQIKKAAQNGNMQSILQGMNSTQAARLEKILSDPEASKKILDTPQAQALIKKLIG